MSKFTIYCFTCLAIFYSAIAVCSDIRLYNWTDYLTPELVEQFKETTGHQVIEDYFDTESLRDELVNSGRGSGFDLVVIDGWTLEQMSQKNLFHNISDLRQELSAVTEPRWQQACGDYGIPYSWGTMGIIHRESVSTTPITSWSQLFSPPTEHSGHIAMYNDVIDAPIAALLAVKADPFTSDRSSLKRAYQQLKKQQQHVLVYQYGDAYAAQNGPLSQMTMTMGYSGDEYSIAENTEQEDWVYTVPSEGTVLWVECLAFPEKTKISPAAYEFVRFLSQPEIAAKNAESIWMATPIPKALPLTSEEYQNDPALFPNQEVLNKSYLYQNIDTEGQRIRFRMMKSLK